MSQHAFGDACHGIYITMCSIGPLAPSASVLCVNATNRFCWCLAHRSYYYHRRDTDC